MPLRPIEVDPDDGIAFLIMCREAYDEDTQAVALIEGAEEAKDEVVALQREAGEDYFYFACQVVGPETAPGRWFGF